MIVTRLNALKTLIQARLTTQFTQMRQQRLTTLNAALQINKKPRIAIHLSKNTELSPLSLSTKARMTASSTASSANRSPQDQNLKSFRAIRHKKQKIASYLICITIDLMGAESSQSILAPISLGELVDKITILEIKATKFSGTKLENTEKELIALQATLKDLNKPIEPHLVDSLRRVNQSLWSIEDDIRNYERMDNFGPQFIALARSVYRQNDKRAAIKKEINLRYDSNLVEEKSYAEY
tara:strand:- start:2118 stop:2834 length:717 start_codon:yes stop_codon:yes gene_type:complete